MNTVWASKTLKLNNLPKDSMINDYLAWQSITEVPVGFSVVTALSALGSLLRRDVWVDQVNWKVYPNLSVLLIGPSGIGKDTAIDASEDVVRSVGGVPVFAGKTIERITDRMCSIGDPAACFIPAPEISAFLGGKDYQKGMSQDITDILSTKKTHDASTKGNPNAIIRNPTMVLQAGSTQEWLHKATPEGSMEGGLWPRFLIVYEEYNSKQVPLLARLDKDSLLAAQEAHERVLDVCREVVGELRKRPRPMEMLEEAADIYTNWYNNRFRLFSKVVQPYANRSRDQVLRVAMLTALSRGDHHTYITAEDMQFSVDIMQYVATTIDRVMKPPTKEAQIARDIVKMLPCTHKDMVVKLGHIYGLKDLLSAIQYLHVRGTLDYQKDEKLYVQKEDFDV